MNWVDLLVVLLAIPAAVSGARQGMVIALPAFVGLLAGAVVAVWIGPVLIPNITHLAFRVPGGQRPAGDERGPHHEEHQDAEDESMAGHVPPDLGLRRLA